MLQLLGLGQCHAIKMLLELGANVSSMYDVILQYHIAGNFGEAFNLVIWRIR